MSVDGDNNQFLCYTYISYGIAADAILDMILAYVFSIHLLESVM